MTISTNIHLPWPVFTIQGYIPSPCSSDLSFLRWRRCYKSRRSFPVYLAKAVQCPCPGQKLAAKVGKSCAISPYVPRVNPGMAADKCINPGGIWVDFCWCAVLLASQNSFPIILYSVASLRLLSLSLLVKCNFSDPIFCSCICLIKSLTGSSKSEVTHLFCWL